MHKKFFTALVTILMLCLICTGCSDSKSEVSDSSKERNVNNVPKDEYAQILATYLDQQLFFKNEPAINSPVYLLPGGTPLDYHSDLYRKLSSKDCLRETIKEHLIKSPLTHSRYLTYEQIEQIADKFVTLQEKFCSYEIEYIGNPNITQIKEPIRSNIRSYNIKIIAPDFVAIEEMIFNKMKNEYLSKLSAPDKEITFENYLDLVNFNEHDRITCGEPNNNPHSGSGDHGNVLWVHYEIDREILGKMIFEQFMSVLNSEQLPTRTINLQVAGYPSEVDMEDGKKIGMKKNKFFIFINERKWGFTEVLDELDLYIWKDFESTITWNRILTDKLRHAPYIYQQTIGKSPAPSVLESDWGSYIPKNAEDTPPCKDTIVSDDLGKFKGVELNEVTLAVCDIKEASRIDSFSKNDMYYGSFEYGENKNYPDYEQKIFEVTLLVDNASNSYFIPEWLVITDEYGDKPHLEIVREELEPIAPHSKNKIKLVCSTDFFFTNDMKRIGPRIIGYEKYTAGYDPNTESVTSFDRNKKKADLVKWQKENKLHVYDMPKEYFIRYGRLIIPMKVTKVN